MSLLPNTEWYFVVLNLVNPNWPGAVKLDPEPDELCRKWQTVQQLQTWLKHSD
jgi:hypothetical protein